MNKKKSIWSGVSVLIAAVLAIVAFVRSDTQIWLLTAAFTIWAIWVTAAFVFPYIQEQENEKRRAARRAAYDAQRQSLRALSVEEEDGFGPLLLRHVNHRISAYLKAVYSSLVIKDNGDICIRQGDVEKAQTSFKSLPEKHYWPRLLKVFEREGIAASMTDDAIALNW